MEPLEIQSATLDEHGDVHVTISGYRFVAQRNIKVLEELLDKGWAAYFPKDDVPPEWLNAYREAPPSHVGNANLDTNKLLLTSHPVLVAIALVDFLDLLDNGDKSSNAVPIPSFEEAVRDIKARRITNIDNLIYRSKVPGIFRWNRDGTRIKPGNEQPICFEIELSESEEDLLGKHTLSPDESDPFILAELLQPSDQIDKSDLPAGFAINYYLDTGLELPTPQIYLVSFKGLITVEELDLDQMLITIPVNDREVSLGDYLLVDSGFPEGGMNLWSVIGLPVDNNVDSHVLYKVHAELVASKTSLVCKLKGNYSTEDVCSDGSLRLVLDRAHALKVVNSFTSHDRRNSFVNHEVDNRKLSQGIELGSRNGCNDLLDLKSLLLRCENKFEGVIPGRLFVDQGSNFWEGKFGSNLTLNFDITSKPYMLPGDFFVGFIRELNEDFCLFSVVDTRSGEDDYEYEVECRLLTSSSDPIIGDLLCSYLIPCKPDSNLKFVDDNDVKAKVLRCFVENDSCLVWAEHAPENESDQSQVPAPENHLVDSVCPRIFLFTGEMEERNRLSFGTATIPFSQIKPEQGDLIVIEDVSRGNVHGLWRIDCVEPASLDERTWAINYDTHSSHLIEVPKHLIDEKYQYLDSAKTCAVISDPCAIAGIIEFCDQAEIAQDIAEFSNDNDEVNEHEGGN